MRLNSPRPASIAIGTLRPVLICVQLPPSDAEQAYLHDYLQREARFEVVWKDLSHYAEELRAL